MGDLPHRTDDYCVGRNNTSAIVWSFYEDVK
jgi:hypothetical protein